jgi:hypothetical protein
MPLLGNETPEDAACRSCLREAVEASREEFKRMFFNQFTRGVVEPHVGLPCIHLRAWALQSATKAEAMQSIVMDMARDLESDAESARQLQKTRLEKIQRVAERLLNDLFPDATLHSLWGPLSGPRLSTFDEALQITSAAISLAQRVEALAGRCPGAQGPFASAC